MRLHRWLSGALAAVVVAAPLLADRKLSGTFRKTRSGLRIAEIRPGRGPKALKGQTLALVYRGWIYDTLKGRQGLLFDANQDRQKPLEFTLGEGGVIKGWEEGLLGARKGAKRILIIPPGLAYGDQGAGEVIPPNATLLFEVEVVGIKGGEVPPAVK